MNVQQRINDAAEATWWNSEVLRSMVLSPRHGGPPGSVVDGSNGHRKTYSFHGLEHALINGLDLNMYYTIIMYMFIPLA